MALTLTISYYTACIHVPFSKATLNNRRVAYSKNPFSVQYFFLKDRETNTCKFDAYLIFLSHGIASNFHIIPKIEWLNTISLSNGGWLKHSFFIQYNDRLIPDLGFLASRTWEFPDFQDHPLVNSPLWKITIFLWVKLTMSYSFDMAIFKFANCKNTV